jgi:NADH-quinone oxidoreductase subunit I
MSQMMRYLKEIVDVIQSTRKGMALTWKHAWDARKNRTQHNIQDTAYFTQTTGIATLEYPHVEIPVPDNGRYQLHNEMDDCIVCDKCVKVCPVDCIEIEPIKATGLVGLTSDGSPIRLYAAKFDIDMSKCCFCGLCTTVCPTECLTMTSEYDFSVYEVKEHNFSFANLTAEEAEEKKRLYEQFVAEKEELKKSADSSQSSVDSSQLSVVSGQSSVVSGQSTVDSSQSSVVSGQSSVVSGQSTMDSSQSPVASQDSEAPASKPAFKPSFKPKTADSSQSPVANPASNLASDVQSPASNLASKP